MKTLEELIDRDDPGIEQISRWVAEADSSCELLPPSDRRADVLVALQVTTGSTLGAVAYETGGILLAQGWLRLLGSGNERLSRDLAMWNEGRSHGFLLVADDIVGGFFALNGGALGSDPGNIYYLAPDTLEWEALEVGYSDFLVWALSSNLQDFYEDLRFPGWESTVVSMSGDRCLQFYPPLWTAEGSVADSQRGEVPSEEAFDLAMDLRSQLRGGAQ